MTPDEKRILELCQRLQELGLNMLVRLKDSSPIASVNGWPDSPHCSNIPLYGITEPREWEYLEGLLGFVERELDRLGKWEKYQEQLGLMWVETFDVYRMYEPERAYVYLSRRPTPLEKLQAAVGAMEE